MGPVAARDPHVSQVIRDTLGDPAPRGALARLAKTLGVSPPAVSRWYTLESSPERTMWPALERALGLDEGTLRSSPAPQLDEASALRQQVELLAAQVEGLMRVVHVQGVAIEQLKRAECQANAD